MLLTAWYTETMFKSYIDTDHWAFKAIVGMGEDAASFIVQNIKIEPNWIVCALDHIYDLVDIKELYNEKYHGRLEKCCEWWIAKVESFE